MKTKNQAGRSMVEMLGVLAIVGVLSAGALKGYSEAMFKYKVNQTIDTFSLVLQRLIELREKDLGDDFSITTADDIIRYGLLPECQKIGNDACKLPIGLLFFDVNASYHFGMTFDSAKECIAFGSAHWENAIPIEWWRRGYMSLENWGTHELYNPRTSTDNTSINGITEACQQECDEDGCEFRFDFEKI